ncbi:MAG: right-handed parallel beta-helix repeat-containing protein [bacterium]|nr:right-handed parallel beta-helix repeat-containing protein [bacterium]
MRKIFVSSALAILFCMPALAASLEFYIATGGADTSAGTKDAPFKSLEAARDAVRALKQAGNYPRGGVTVLVREGVYPRTGPFELAADDSGQPGGPVTYRAAPGEEVRVTGGVTVTGFAVVEDETTLARLPEEARGKVMQTDLKAQGVTDFGKLTPRGFSRPETPAGLELFFDDRPMQIARWPNEGWQKVVSAPEGATGGQFTYDGDRPARWVSAEDPWLFGYWTWDWADSYVGVASIDPEKKLFVTEEPHGVYGYKVGQRYYALNLLEELDVPGEWYLNRDTGILYFWPPAPIASARTVVSIATSLVTVNEASHVTLQGFTLEACRGHAVTVRGGSYTRLAGCTLRNIGLNAVVVSGGHHNGVVGCDISECDRGMSVSGGDRKTLEPCSNYAVNNHIRHYGRWCRTYRPAVGVGGVGIRVAHNLIHDAPHNGIQLGGNENLIEFNELYAICQETGDVGAYYMGRDWTTRGNTIRHNFFHDIRGPYTHGAMAVYLDDAASGTIIYGNVFCRASRAAFIGGGRDNVVDNNIFVECHPGVHIDSRGLGWAKKYIVKGGGWHMYDKLEAMNYTEPPYSTRYPKLVGILDDDPAVPKDNIITRNVFFGGDHFGLSKEGKQFAAIKDNFTEGDPGFVDLEKMNLQLKDDSPVYEKVPGFKRIPFERIGLYLDEYRTAKP